MNEINILQQYIESIIDNPNIIIKSYIDDYNNKCTGCTTQEYHSIGISIIMSITPRIIRRIDKSLLNKFRSIIVLLSNIIINDAKEIKERSTIAIQKLDKYKDINYDELTKEELIELLKDKQ